MSPKKLKKRGEIDLPKNNNILIILISINVILVAVIFACVWSSQKSIKIKIEDEPVSEPLIVDDVKRLRYWGVVAEVWHTAGHLRSMERIFESLQYKFVNGSLGDDWDILWSIEHPYPPFNKTNHPLFGDVYLKPLRQDQKINHFPGISTLVSKSNMNDANKHLKYILPSFVLPQDKEELFKFIKNNPDAKLVEKRTSNRGVQIVTPDEILFDRSDYFYQQFMDKPFLIDGQAFDFGVFVLITSFDPIRAYRFDTDVLFRFCPEKYYPFDPEIFAKYVVEKGCLPPYKMKMFEETYQIYQYPFKRIFEHHIEQKGFNAKELWRKIDDAIASTIVKAEKRVLRKLKERELSSHNFFELVRYDFIFDENLEPFLMEVNMSPNLTPAEELYELNSLIYEPLIFNTIKMIGGGSYFEFMSRFNDSDITVAGKKNIATNIKSCLQHQCHEDCYSSKCQICPSCIDSSQRYQMREAFREHLYEGHFRRVFPKLMHFNDQNLYQSMTDNNKISIDWFKAKCEEDVKWC